MDFFTGAALFIGLSTCPVGAVDYCPSGAMGTFGAEMTVAEYRDFSLTATAQHYSDATDNGWLDGGPVHWINTGDRGTEFYGLQIRYKLW